MSKCLACSWQGLPRRSWCPRCGSADISAVRVTRGVLAETTVVNRSPRGSTVTESGDGVTLGVVHADGGGTLVARVSRGAVASQPVVLGEVGGAVHARDASEVGR